MGKQSSSGKSKAKAPAGRPSAGRPSAGRPSAGRPSALIDTRVIYCGDNLEQLQKLPDHCVDLIYIDPPFNSNRTVEVLGEVFWGETKEKRSFDDRHASTQAYIEYMRPRCVQLARVLKKTGSFYNHCAPAQSLTPAPLEFPIDQSHPSYRVFTFSAFLSSLAAFNLCTPSGLVGKWAEVRIRPELPLRLRSSRSIDRRLRIRMPSGGEGTSR